MKSHSYPLATLTERIKNKSVNMEIIVVVSIDDYFQSTDQGDKSQSHQSTSLH
jgi:hypothetical protein